MTLAESMRRDWDERARKDGFYYIASWRTDWDLPEFLTSGSDDYQRLVAPMLERAGFLPEGKTMVELGCGAGRMTHAFAKHFSRVIAFDLSSEMLEQAKKNLKGSPRITWVQGNGVDLRGAADESADFVFSYLVLQHMPNEALVRSYIHEMQRVLKPGGLCLFQFNGSKRPTMNWRGQLAWSAVDTLWSIGLHKASRGAARAFGFDPQMAGKSWHGAAVPAGRIASCVQESGAEVLELNGEDTAMAWCCARKWTSTPSESSKTST